MYQYVTSGLENVVLKNGYDVMDVGGEQAVSIHDLEGLHHAIATELVKQPRLLSGAEFRFLRTQLDMSQKVMGEILGHKDGQSVAKWEKKDRVPQAGDLIIRTLYIESVGDNPVLRDLIKLLSEVDDQVDRAEFRFEEAEDGGWRAAA